MRGAPTQSIPTHSGTTVPGDTETGDSALAETGDTGHTDDTEPPFVEGPARYPHDQVHSPITPRVAANLRDIAVAGEADVFMKVGASTTTSSHFLGCFAGGGVDLDVHEALRPTLDFYLAGDAAGDTPFDRTTEAAQSGMSAGWAISGDPSPIEIEIAAIDPRLAFVHYGTNDMGLGLTYASASWGFYDDLSELVRQLVDAGILPILNGIPHRLDSEAADKWVATYNGIIRGVAQSWQVPFIDQFVVLEPLPEHGLSGDGIHLSLGPYDACDLSPDGLDYGYNTRNLVSLESLDRLHRVLDLAEDAPDVAHGPLQGDGSWEAPLVIEGLPFAHQGNTDGWPVDVVDVYDACSDSDESGPEVVYRFVIEETTPLRLMVFDTGDVDIDLHLLDDSGTPQGCIERDHQLIETTLGAGTYHLALDTWVDGSGDVLSGEFMLLVVPCDADDADCA